MLTRLLLSLLLGLALSSEANAQKRSSMTAVGPAARGVVEKTPARRIASAAFVSDQIAFSESVPSAHSPSALFATNGVDLYMNHFDFTDEWLAERPGIWREDRFAGIDPADLDTPASFVEVFIDDWKFASYRSFSFHVLADDVVGLEIKSRFSL